jgi:hypothetical protein
MPTPLQDPRFHGLRVSRRPGIPVVGFPLNTDNLTAVLALGLRIRESGSVVSSARRAAVVLLALLTWPPRDPRQTLTVDTVGVQCGFARRIQLLKGDPLARLKDGRSVRVNRRTGPARARKAAATTRRIFALSYDLWEERFAVTAVDKRSQSVSHLMAAAAEAWCVEQLSTPLSALGSLGRDLPFWIRLEYRVLEGDSTSDPSESGYTLQGLIDALSRRLADSAFCWRPSWLRRARRRDDSSHAPIAAFCLSAASARRSDRIPRRASTEPAIFDNQ